VPFTPKVLQAKERAPTISPSIVLLFKLIIESIKELASVLPKSMQRIEAKLDEHMRIVGMFQ
jgi:hypothetical protein